MKQFTGLFCISLFLAIEFASFFSSCRNESSNRKGELIIADFRTGEEPEENLASHNAYDAEVFRTSFMEGAYTMRIYQNEADSLRSHSALLVGKEDFDKATYQWMNDSCVTFKLLNSESAKEKSVKVCGRGKRTSLSVDTIPSAF